MGLNRGRCSDALRAAAVAALVGLLLTSRERPAEAQSPAKAGESAATAGAARDVRSHSFLLHTDLADREAGELVQRLETMLRQISTYWGRPMQGIIECYVVRDFRHFPLDAMDARGIAGIKSAGGVTLLCAAAAGSTGPARPVIYATARPEVVMHEAVHAYCQHAFGRVGPVWYSEGMAEMGHYWQDGDIAVRAGPREIRFLRENLPSTLAGTLSPLQVSGDSWQNYAARWALCHFLVHDPNFSPQFLAMGRGLLSGRDVRFEQTYGAAVRQLRFEYLFFLQHIEDGYRVDLCAWDWNKKFAPLRPGQVVAASIRAGRGWQPTGLTVAPDTQYEYVASGGWRTAHGPKDDHPDGVDHGCGQLSGVLMKDYQLGPEFDVGPQGTFPGAAGGDLYLRCRKAWNELAADSGRVAVRLKLDGLGAPLRTAAAVPVVTAAVAGGAARTN
jgi:hypothetical protein